MGVVRDKLTAGDFNNLDQQGQPDGSVMVTLTKRGDPRRYIMKVRDLYGPDEVVESEMVKEPGE